MTRAIRAPGLDRAPALSNTPPNVNYVPGNGAGGVFAGFMQGATPKYAINDGFRQDLFRNTLARMFVRVDASEMNTFLASIGDTHTRSQLAERITGDPTQQEGNQQTGGTGTADASVRRSTTAQSNGYLDFLIQNIQMSLQEKVQVSETLSDNYVAYTFGQSPPMWNFAGTLINSVQDDQASNMFRLYTQILRATQMARRQKSMSLSYDSYVVNGVMVNLNLGMSSNNELLVPFSFQLLVKRVFITNYTSGWVPTRATSPFAADLNAIAYDGRPRSESAMTQIAARISPDLEDVSPTPEAQIDSRCLQMSSMENGTSTPNYLDSQITIPNSSSDQNRSSVLAQLVGGSSSNQALRRILLGQMQRSVQNPRFEAVNPSGVSSNPNVNPGTPATNNANLFAVMQGGSR